jgi:hypothetical protein
MGWLAECCDTTIRYMIETYLVTCQDGAGGGPAARDGPAVSCIGDDGGEHPSENFN